MPAEAAMRGFVTFIRCEESELALLRERLGQWLEAHRVPDRVAFEVKLLAHEAAKNAIQHSDPCDSVEAIVELDDHEVVVRIVDTNARPWELESSDDGVELHGLTLIHALAHRVETVRQENGTALVMKLDREA